MIGVFDSGYGGLSVLKNLLKYCSGYDYVYLGDNARVPYGDKSEEIIYEYTKEAVDYLFRKDCRLIILACNTATATSLRRLQKEYLPINYPKRRILGVIKPIAEGVAGDKSIDRVAVIGTKATIESRVYKKEIAKLSKSKTILERSTPLLAHLIEEDKINKKALDIILEDYLHFVFEEKIDELILACTHYPLIIDSIRKKIPKNCRLVDPGEFVAKSLKDYLIRHPELGLKKKSKTTSNLRFLTTDCPKTFKERGTKFLGQFLSNVEKIYL